MTRDEAQSAIHEIVSEADISRQSACASATDGDPMGAHGHLCEETGLRRSARIFAKALEKSEAASDATTPLRVTLRISTVKAATLGISYGSSWCASPMKIQEAGPGLWQGIGLTQDRGDWMMTVEQVAP